jgi:hypothetical protein
LRRRHSLLPLNKGDFHMRKLILISAFVLARYRPRPVRAAVSSSPPTIR